MAIENVIVTPQLELNTAQIVLNIYSQSGSDRFSGLEL